MGSLDSTTAIYRIGRSLELAPEKRKVNSILTWVDSTVEEALAGMSLPVETPKDLEKALAKYFRVTIERVTENNSLQAVGARREYFNPRLSQLLTKSFEEQDLLGRLFCNPSPDDGRTDRFLIVSDGRGEKSARTEFTVWHEFAHVMTQYFPDNDGDVRTPNEEPTSPGEALMDIIAARLMFYRDMWTPIWAEVVDSIDNLRFEVIESVRQKYNPSASFFSTAVQCVKKFHRPCRLIRTSPALKVEEVREKEERERQPDFFANDPTNKPPPLVRELRAVDCIWPLSRHQQGDPLEIWGNMRVPKQSVIRQVFEGDRQYASVYTNQDSWETSSQGALSSLPLVVEAKQYGPNTLALIQPNWNEVYCS